MNTLWFCIHSLIFSPLNPRFTPISNGIHFTLMRMFNAFKTSNWVLFLLWLICINASYFTLFMLYFVNYNTILLRCTIVSTPFDILIQKKNTIYCARSCVVELVVLRSDFSKRSQLFTVVSIKIQYFLFTLFLKEIR